MTTISEALWQTYFPETTMPPGCTYKQLYVAREELWRQDDLADLLEDLTKLNKLKSTRTDSQQIQEYADKEIAELMGELANDKL